MYLGGFYSPMQLTIGRWQVGAGLFATNKRLFIFRLQRFLLKKIVNGADSGDFVPSNLTKEQNDAILQQLLQYKELEARKESISLLELKKPPGMLRTGNLKINLISGNNLEMRIGKSKEYEWILRILREFHPTALKIVE